MQKKITKVAMYVISSGVVTQLLNTIAEGVQQAEFSPVITITVMAVVNVLLFLAVKGREALKS